jgi:hypothetical protein
MLNTLTMTLAAKNPLAQLLSICVSNGRLILNRQVFDLWNRLRAELGGFQMLPVPTKGPSQQQKIKIIFNKEKFEDCMKNGS